MKKLLAALTLAFAISSAQAAHFWVRTDGHDTNCDGTANVADDGVGGITACAKLTINGGLALWATPGDIVTVGPGTFSGAVSVPHKNGGSAATNFILEGDSTIPSATIITNTVTLLSGSSAGRYMTMRNLTIRPTVKPAIFMQKTGSSANDWMFITLSYINMDQIPATGSDCMYCEQNQNNNGQNTFDHITISNGGVRANATGMHTYSSQGYTVSNSLFADLNSHAIWESSQGSLAHPIIITGNLFRNIAATTLSSTVDGDGVLLQGYNTYFIASYNVADNVSSNSDSLRGMFASRQTNAGTDKAHAFIFHNTFISRTDGNKNTINDCMTAIDTNVTEFFAHDNICIGYGGTHTTQAGALVIRGCPVSYGYDHNLYYGTLGGGFDIRDPSGCLGGDNLYGPGDKHGQNPLLDPTTYVPAIGSPACNAASDGTAIGAKDCPPLSCE